MTEATQTAAVLAYIFDVDDIMGVITAPPDDLKAEAEARFPGWLAVAIVPPGQWSDPDIDDAGEKWLVAMRED